MMLTLHLVLITTVVLATVGLLIWDHGWPRRPLKKLLASILPFLTIGVLCGLLLSATGAPILEWALPTTCILLIGLICRSDRVFQIARWTMLAVAIGLCVNFTSLVHSKYTAAPAYSRRIADLRRNLMIKAAGEALRQNFPAQTILPAGPVGKLLNDPQYNTAETAAIEFEWHTSLTRLYRLRHGRVQIWYPGGEVNTASHQLKLRDDTGA